MRIPITSIPLGFNSYCAIVVNFNTSYCWTIEGLLSSLGRKDTHWVIKTVLECILNAIPVTGSLDDTIDTAQRDWLELWKVVKKDGNSKFTSEVWDHANGILLPILAKDICSLMMHTTPNPNQTVSIITKGELNYVVEIYNAEDYYITGPNGYFPA